MSEFLIGTWEREGDVTVKPEPSTADKVLLVPEKALFFPTFTLREENKLSLGESSLTFGKAVSWGWTGTVLTFYMGSGDEKKDITAFTATKLVNNLNLKKEVEINGTKYTLEAKYKKK